MLEDKKTIQKFNRGSKKAFRDIYLKHKDHLFSLAFGLLRDKNLAEDVVHDVFVSFARTVGSFRLKGTLKGYLSVCTANRARDKNRAKSQDQVSLEDSRLVESQTSGPIKAAMKREHCEQVNSVLQRIPYEQREVIVLHLHHNKRFREIAEICGVTVSTAQSRYQYGLDKLRSLLNNVEV
jgi:RNA polymerase sigma-70 factor (ECF subfamily)